MSRIYPLVFGAVFTGSWTVMCVCAVVWAFRQQRRSRR